MIIIKNIRHRLNKCSGDGFTKASKIEEQALANDITRWIRDNIEAKEDMKVSFNIEVQ